MLCGKTGIKVCWPGFENKCHILFPHRLNVSYLKWWNETPRQGEEKNSQTRVSIALPFCFQSWIFFYFYSVDVLTEGLGVETITLYEEDLKIPFPLKCSE